MATIRRGTFSHVYNLTAAHFIVRSFVNSSALHFQHKYSTDTVPGVRDLISMTSSQCINIIFITAHITYTIAVISTIIAVISTIIAVISTIMGVLDTSVSTERHIWATPNNINGVDDWECYGILVSLRTWIKSLLAVVSSGLIGLFCKEGVFSGSSALAWNQGVMITMDANLLLKLIATLVHLINTSCGLICFRWSW